MLIERRALGRHPSERSTAPAPLSDSPLPLGAVLSLTKGEGPGVRVQPGAATALFAPSPFVLRYPLRHTRLHHTHGGTP